MYKTCLDAEKEFEICWHNPAYVAIQLDDVDINKVLAHYALQKPLHFTMTMLWDMETKKAWNPEKYIPYVVKPGSAKSWHKQTCPDTGGVIFVRCSAQKKWLDPSSYEEVYEEVYVNEQKKQVTFLGVTQLPENDKIIHPTQPLFHVQHGASGTEDRPLNTWRIVLLTNENKRQYINLFNSFNNSAKLPGFIEAYIEKDLGVGIKMNIANK